MSFHKILCLCLLLIPCIVFSADKSSNSNLESVKLQLKWFHSFQFAGYYAAKEQGYYKEENLDVDILERSPEASVTAQVISGRVDYGVGSSGILLQYAKNKSIKALAAIFQHSPLVFISKQSSGIIGLPEMLDKRIMIYVGGDSTNQAVLKALLDDAKIFKRQYSRIPLSFNTDNLITDQTDVIAANITNDLFYYQKKGIKINIIHPKKYGFDFYDHLLFTSKSELQNHPGRAERFRRASLKGWAYALKHPEQLIRLIHTQYHSKSSLDLLRFEAKEISKLIVAEQVPLGQISSVKLRQIADTYHDLNLIADLANNDLKNFIYVSQPDLKLTTKERQWLARHSVIRLGIDRDFAPHEWVDKKGNYTGYAADYIKLLEKRLNIKFKIIKDKSWPDIIKMAKQQNLDMLSDVISTPERQQYLDFTAPYISNPAIIINDISHAYIGHLKNLYHKKVSIEKDYFLNDLLSKEHPEIIIVPAENTRHALDMVASGEVTAYIGDAATANYAISHAGLLNLRFSGQSGYMAKHSIGVIKSQPLLTSIMNKALASITQEEKTTITNRWLGLVIKQGINIKTALIYVAGILVLFLLFTYWIFRLRQEVERRQTTENNLRKTQERFIKSQHSAAFGIWDWNIITNKLYWSETVPPLFGYKAAEQENANFFSYMNTVHPDDRKLVGQAIKSSIEDHHSYRVEHRVIWPDGTIHWLQEAGDIIIDDKGNATHLLGIVRDISQSKKTEKLLKEHRNRLQAEVKLQTQALEDAKDEAVRANYAKSDFLANMSHELRTPMHGILSFTRLGIKNIEQGDLEKLAKYFDRINVSAERLLPLLNDLLDLSKLEAHKMAINKEQCNLYLLVQDCLAEQEALLKDKRLTICWQNVCDKPDALFDKARFAQVVSNLLSNAIKFSEPNKNIFLGISNSELNNQAALTFMIQDEGEGIPEQELKTVFDKFIQSSKTSTDAGGTGLGLAICYEILATHQGKIWAENSSQGGTIFQFTIPIA